MNKRPSNIGKTTPLSFPQRRIWFLQELYDDDVMYNTNRCFRIQGALDAETLKVTLQMLAVRHEPLRTRFRVVPDGLPCQVFEETPEIKIEYVDLHETPEADSRALAGQVIQEAVVRPFKLNDELMIRVVLIRLNASETILLFVQHHIITDYSSWRLLLAEFTAVYATLIKGISPSLTPLPWHYSDFAKKQALLLTNETIARKKKYWRDFFAGYSGLALTSGLSSRCLSNTTPPSYNSTWQFIPADTVSKCKMLADSQKCTLFIVVLTAITLLVRFLYGHPQVLVCLASANRQFPGAEKVIGCFFTNIIMSLNIRSDQKLVELIQDVKTTVAAERRQQDMPFEMFAEDLGLAFTLQRKPPYRVYISYRHSADEVDFSLPNTRITRMEASTGRNTQEDVVFNFWEKRSDGRLCLDLEWLCRTDMFDQEERKKLAVMLQALLNHLTENIEHNVGNLQDRLVDSDQWHSLS